ncbi:hypothetical protein GUJ93_ZPchr0001g33163 [Zizania palustris]|uniref:Uncharacterized protein n=1 Tax=Zizania palustris TaxID=103762 RepID=A0A8J5V0W3_ZIZPA|nr:hypothetical protein GUJ93_ZPchr0001g33163 [Zizania palustris]
MTPDGSVPFDVELGDANQSGSGPSPVQQLARLALKLVGIGFTTVFMATGIIFHNEPPHVLLFYGHPIAYYLTLMSIFIAGVFEIGTAFGVSRAHDDGEAGDGRRIAFGRAVLWASIIPLATVGGLGGYTIRFKA